MIGVTTARNTMPAGGPFISSDPLNMSHITSTETTVTLGIKIGKTTITMGTMMITIATELAECRLQTIGDNVRCGV